MSYYDASGTVTVKVPNIEVARDVLRHYVTIFSNDAGLHIFRDEPKIGEDGNLILTMSSAVRLTEDEASIIDSIGFKDNYKDHVRDIFIGRATANSVDLDNGADYEQVDDRLSELIFNLERNSDISTFDILSEMNITEARVDCNIYASGNVYNGYEVQMPGDGLEIIEHYRVDHNNQYALVSQEKIVKLGDDKSNDCEFDFEKIENLLWLSLSDLRVFSAKVTSPQLTADEETYTYKLTTVSGHNILTTTFKYKAPANKRLRAKKHIRLFATVTRNGDILWTGDDPSELKNVLNDWVSAYGVL